MDRWEELKQCFNRWEAATHWKMKLISLTEGAAITETYLHPAMRTPHESPMLLGMMGGVLANNTGVAALWTVIGDDEAPLLPEPPKGKFCESFVPAEEYIHVEARIINDRKWTDETNKKKRQIIVRADIKNLNLVLKGRLDFIYIILPADKIRQSNEVIANTYPYADNFD